MLDNSKQNGSRQLIYVTPQQPPGTGLQTFSPNLPLLVVYGPVSDRLVITITASATGRSIIYRLIVASLVTLGSSVVGSRNDSSNPPVAWDSWVDSDRLPVTTDTFTEK